MLRTDIINSLIYSNEYQTYLEIGVRNLDDNFNKIIAPQKTGVDPDVNSKASFIMTSDDFFKINTRMFDIIFIDGLHLCEQVLKDIENSLKILNEDGIIICHDCLPNNESEQVENYDGISAWVGTVWKAIAHLNMTRSDLEIKIVDTDYGCGLLKKGNQTLYPQIAIEKMDWNFYNNNKYNLFNIIDIKKFKESYCNS